MAGLEREALCGHPFFGPAALAAAREVLPQADAARLALVRDRAGRLAGCLPLRPPPSGLLPRPARSLDHPYCFLRAPLVRAADAGPVLGALVRGWWRLGVGGPALGLGGFPEGPLLEELRRTAAAEGAGLVELRPAERALMRPAACGETFVREALPRKRRKELGRLRRRLADEGPLVFEVIREPGRLEAAVADFLRLEAAGWKGRAGTALAAAGHAAFLERLARELGPSGRLSLPVLRLGERPVAMLVCLDSAGPDATTYLFKIAHDEEFAGYSPGVLLVLDYTRWRHAQGLKAPVDSCARSGHGMIERLWPDRRRLVEVLLLPAVRGSRATGRLLAGLGRLRASWRSWSAGRMPGAEAEER